MVFLLPSATPPPPGLAKDHKKYVFFFRHPSLRAHLQRLLGYGAEQDDIVLILGQDRLVLKFCIGHYWRLPVEQQNFNANMSWMSRSKKTEKSDSVWSYRCPAFSSFLFAFEEINSSTETTLFIPRDLWCSSAVSSIMNHLMSLMY